jgi:hypothetical protein
VLFLACFSLLLAGCQSPAHSVAGQPAAVNYALVDIEATARTEQAMPSRPTVVKAEPCVLKTGAPENSKPKDESLATNAPKTQECLTGELGDAFLLVLKTFTGR